MIRRSLAAAAAATLVATLAQPAMSASANDSPKDQLTQATGSPGKALSKGTVLSLGTKSGPELYIVQLDAPAAPTRGTLGRDAGLQKADEKSYVAGLKTQQAHLTSEIRGITRTTPKVKYSYTQAINGIAVELTREQALEVSELDGVSAVQVDEQRQLQTDVGPEWIGAPGIWSGDDVPDETGTKGEGIIVGVLDSGINPANPSFAASVAVEDGGDGYAHVNPFGAGNYVGVCDPDSDVFIDGWGCNDKLVGYWNMTGDGDDYDDDGHGTHTASTSAGNQVDVTTFAAEGDPDFEFSADENIKGVAPHANIIAYDVCDGGCSLAAITAGIEQAIADGVDVINYSIGSSAASSPWTDADAVGFLNARAAGIYVATSAGNDGPGAETVGSPADVPWITSVGATQHNRQWQASVQNITDGVDTLPDIAGVAFAKASDGSFPLVTGASLGSATCEAADLAGEVLDGKIVVCDRGGTAGRVEKGTIVAALGAEGMILANNAANGTSLNADPHDLPAVHITFDAGVALKAFMAANPGTEASLSGAIRHVGDDVADIMAGFSSRGANRAVSMISPSLSAPGVDILAGNGHDNEVSWGFISGTSMASPHTAGSYALIKSVHPEWSPAEAQSALMMTTKTDIRDNDLTEADWFDMGSGRVDLTKVTKAGLVQDVVKADYLAADPAEGGDVRDLNTASMADNECLAVCDWTRSFTATDTGAGTWTVAVESMDDGMTLSVDQPSFTVAAGGSVDLTVTADVSGQPTDEWLFGTLVLTPPAGSVAPAAHLPIAVLPSNGVLPSVIDITTRRDAGSQVTDGLKAAAIDSLQIGATGLVPEDVEEVSAPQDTTNDDAFDDLTEVSVTEFAVPAGSTRFSARLEDATAPDFDMFVGTGDVEAGNVLCASASGGSAEHCDLATPEAGTYWVLVQNWEASDPEAIDTADLVTSIVGGDAGNLSATGPAGAVPAGEPFSIRTFWDESDMEAGDTWQGALTLGTGAGSPDNIGVVPVTIHRVDDDVTKTADVETAAVGETVTYTVAVQPNVSQEDLTYTITDTLPEGTTYVEGSATGGATVSGDTVSWTDVLPTAFGKEGDYEIRSSKTDPSCVNPFTGTAAYLNLEAFGLKADPGAVGDTKSFKFFDDMSLGLYGKSYAGLSFTDDGFLVYDAEENYAGEPFINQELPDVTAPNAVAAPLWQDMEIKYDLATNTGVTLATSNSGLAIVEYDNIAQWVPPGSPTPTVNYDFEVFAKDGSNDLVFVYGNMTGPLNNVTIGVENPAGTKATTLVNAGSAVGAITNNTAVCLDYVSPTGDAREFTYQVTVDEGVHNRQVLTNNAVHTTSDPGAKSETATATVTVGDSSERTETALSLDPNPVVTGGSTTATATVFSAGESEATGTVEFLIAGTVAGTGTLDATGKATASLTAPATEGVYQVTARYLGDAANLPSTSAPSNLAVTKPATPPTPGPSPTPTPTPTPTPSPVVKVQTKIVVKTPKQVKVLSGRGKVTFVVTAADITPSGAVKVQIKGAGKNKRVTVLLDAAGKGKVKLPTYKRTGRVKVTVSYGGDVVSLSSSEVKRFRVVS